MKCNIPKTNKRLDGIIQTEVHKYFAKKIDKYNYETALQIMHILRFDYGFGQARLEQFAHKLKDMQDGQIERYELDAEETPSLCREQLENSGIDVVRILGERSEYDGVEQKSN